MAFTTARTYKRTWKEFRDVEESDNPVKSRVFDSANTCNEQEEGG